MTDVMWRIHDSSGEDCCGVEYDSSGADLCSVGYMTVAVKFPVLRVIVYMTVVV